MIYSKNHRVIAKGLDNISILCTNKYTATVMYNEAQNIQNYVKREAAFAVESNIEFRPWGYFINLKEKPGYKIKKIVVMAGQKLSMQLHHFRAEQWTVVNGQGLAVIGNQYIKLQQGKSLFIHAKEKHRLINNSTDNLEIIEVQIGEVLQEDDIERFDDVYGRA